MFRKIKKLLLLPKSERWLFFHVFFLTGLVRAMVLVFPFRWIAPYLGVQGAESPDKMGYEQREIGLRIGQVILRVSGHTPWQSKCLVQAITGKILLRRAGINNTLYLGVKKAINGELVAHAWLRAGEMIITGERSWKGFLSLSSFSEGKVSQVRESGVRGFGE